MCPAGLPSRPRRPTLPLPLSLPSPPLPCRLRRRPAAAPAAPAVAAAVRLAATAGRQRRPRPLRLPAQRPWRRPLATPAPAETGAFALATLAAAPGCDQRQLLSARRPTAATNIINYNCYPATLGSQLAAYCVTPVWSWTGSHRQPPSRPCPPALLPRPTQAPSPWLPAIDAANRGGWVPQAGVAANPRATLDLTRRCEAQLRQQRQQWQLQQHPSAEASFRRGLGNYQVGTSRHPHVAGMRMLAAAAQPAAAARLLELGAATEPPTTRLGCTTCCRTAWRPTPGVGGR